MIVRDDLHARGEDIRIDALLLRGLVSAALRTDIGAMIKAGLVRFDVVPGVIPGVVLGSFHGFILG